MNTHQHSSKLALLAAGLLLTGVSADAANCSKVAADVRAAIEANPSKVLIIVEDAMVSNESCACEIVKAALVASNANADLARQIVLTATNVAPNLSKLIAECARGVLAGGGTSTGGKEVKNVLNVQPLGVDTGSSGADYRPAPADIRGVYLIQPSSGGGVVLKDCECDDDEDGGSHDAPKKKKSPPKSQPQSPSTACPND